MTSVSSNKNQYDVLEVIGTGSFGKVCKVRRHQDGALLVWKEINFGKMSEKEKEQLVSEVNILRELKNPVIVRYHDRIIDKLSTTIFIIMEHCPGGDLGKAVQKHKKDGTYMEESAIWKVLVQCILALKDCHNRADNVGTANSNGSSGNSKDTKDSTNQGNLTGAVLHRDLKPANILIDANNNIKIGDFGLAKELSSRSQLAQTNVGTPFYMAPEIMNDKEYDAKSDIWSLGCLVYELAALRPPFDASNAVSLALKVNQGRFPRLPARYSRQLMDIIISMLQVDPRKRPNIDELERLVEDSGAPAQAVLARARAIVVEHDTYARTKDLRAREVALIAKEQMLATKERTLREREQKLHQWEKVLIAQQAAIDKQQMIQQSTETICSSVFNFCGSGTSSSAEVSSGAGEMPLPVPDSSIAATVAHRRRSFGGGMDVCQSPSEMPTHSSASFSASVAKAELPLESAAVRSESFVQPVQKSAPFAIHMDAPTCHTSQSYIHSSSTEDVLRGVARAKEVLAAVQVPHSTKHYASMTAKPSSHGLKGNSYIQGVNVPVEGTLESAKNKVALSNHSDKENIPPQVTKAFPGAGIFEGFTAVQGSGKEISAPVAVPTTGVTNVNSAILGVKRSVNSGCEVPPAAAIPLSTVNGVSKRVRPSLGLGQVQSTGGGLSVAPVSTSISALVRRAQPGYTQPVIGESVNMRLQMMRR